MIVTLDFETYFDPDIGYTLKSMSTEHYVRHPEFKAFVVGIKRGETPAVWYPADYLINHVHLREEITRSVVLAMNAQFDGLILSHHYGLKPKLWLDLLSLARLKLRRLKSHSLASLAKHFALPDKSIDYNAFKGIRDLPQALMNQVGQGACDDCELEYEIYKRLAPGTPREEVLVQDQTIRLFSEPVLRLDRLRLEAFLHEERARKADLMFDVADTLGLDDGVMADEALLALVETELQSSAKFKTALESLGYECPTKFSEKAKCEMCAGKGVVQRERDATSCCEVCNSSGKGGFIPALAKNDDGMRELLSHDDARVQALAAARLGVKSTLNETRAESMLATDSRGPVPIYLNYALAHTLRWTGGGDNFQNMPRGGELRKSILPPEDHHLMVGDLSQIEYRLLCWVSGQFDKLEALRQGRDLYCEFASELYGETVTKEDKSRRGTGKQGTLQCGYGAGGESIARTAKSGAYGPPVIMQPSESLHVRDTYRRLHPCVAGKGGMWAVCEHSLLPALAHGLEMQWSVFRIAEQRVYLPNGTWMDYGGLHWNALEQEWQRPTKKGIARLWGSKLTADLIQALARLVMTQAIVRLMPQNWKFALTVHDELAYVVPSDEPLTVKPVTAAQATPGTRLAAMLAEMVRTPAWADARLVLEAEGQTGLRYEK